MSEEMQQALIWILGAVSLVAVLGWIFTYLRLRGTFFVVDEDSLKVTYYFLDERQYTDLDTDEADSRVDEYLPQAETIEHIYRITGPDVMVTSRDTYLRKVRSMKPPHMRLIAIQIELVPGKPR